MDLNLPDAVNEFNQSKGLGVNLLQKDRFRANLDWDLVPEKDHILSSNLLDEQGLQEYAKKMEGQRYEEKK